MIAKIDTAVMLRRHWHTERAGALRHGFKKLGIHFALAESVESLEWFERNSNLKCAVRGGMSPADDEVAGWCESRGCPVLVTDLGYLNRANRDGEAGYYQLGLGRIGWTPETSPHGGRLAQLGIELKPYVESGGDVLVLGQMPGDTQHRLDEDELSLFYLEAVESIGEAAGRVVWRPHPRCADMASPDPAWIRDEGTLQEALATASIVVTYNSTAGLEAIAEGRRVVCAPEAHYAPLAGQADQEERRGHFERLSWAQWTLKEFRSGEALRFVLRQAGALAQG